MDPFPIVQSLDPVDFGLALQGSYIALLNWVKGGGRLAPPAPRYRGADIEMRDRKFEVWLPAWTTRGLFFRRLLEQAMVIGQITDADLMHGDQ